jgi:hypothetical protein
VQVLRQLAPITARWQTGAVCVSCYPRIRANPVPCPGCGQSRVLTSLDDCGRVVCQACAGHAETYLCRRCSEPAEGFTRGRCTRCALGERVAEVLGDQASGNLAPIRDALCSAGNPKSVLTWLAATAHGC